MTIEFETLVTENQLAAEYLSGLERGFLAEKFFYWFPLSVRAWLDLCNSSQPYKNYSRSLELLTRHALEIAAACSARDIEVVGLGAGQGDKDVLLLEALRSSGKTVFYRPVDSSMALLEMAVGRAVEHGCAGRGLKADIEDARTAHWLSKTAARPRLYLILGNSLGITDPSNFLRLLRVLLRPQDWVLLDGEIFNPDTTLLGYDHPANRRFAFAPLASLGLKEEEDGELIFTLAPAPQLEGLYWVQKYFQAARPLSLPVAGKWIQLKEGQKVRMSPSWKYARPALDGLIRETGGLSVAQEWVSDDGQFVMSLARRQNGA